MRAPPAQRRARTHTQPHTGQAAARSSYDSQLCMQEGAWGANTVPDIYAVWLPAGVELLGQRSAVLHKTGLKDMVADMCGCCMGHHWMPCGRVYTYISVCECGLCDTRHCCHAAIALLVPC